MLEGAADRLRSQGLRLTRQRRQVIEALARSDPPTSAEELAALLPDVHPSSVYRSLAALEEVGVIRHVHLAHGPARYEIVPAEDTRHLVCEVCGRHVVVPAGVLDDVRRRLEVEAGFVLDSVHFALTGRCVTCARAGRAGSHGPRPA